MAASPELEWEASGVDECQKKNVVEKVESEVAKCSDGASGIKEGKTSCAKGNSTPAGIDDRT